MMDTSKIKLWEGVDFDGIEIPLKLSTDDATSMKFEIYPDYIKMYYYYEDGSKTDPNDPYMFSYNGALSEYLISLGIRKKSFGEVINEALKN